MTDELAPEPEVVDDRPKIAASERDLLVMARALVTPDLDPWTTPRQSRKLPPHIGTTAAELIGEALARAWLALWRRGGSAPVQTIAAGGEAVTRGRTWQRHRPVALKFTAASIALLRWLVSTPPSIARDNIQALKAMPLELGDEVVLYLALDAATGTFIQTALARQPFTHASPLAWLGFAHVMPDRDPPEGGFAGLVTGPGAIVVEAVQADLAARWRQVELMKRGAETAQGRSPTIDRVIALGRLQDATLTGFMTACDTAHRRDLALFIVDAIAPLLARNLPPVPPPLDPGAPLSQRFAARRAAGSLVRAVLRWRTWDAEHRAIRFVDDGYQAAQLLLVRYEAVGSAGGDRADAWLAELSQLTPSATVADPREPA